MNVVHLLGRGCLSLALVGLLVPAAARAADAPRQHDTGFFLRLSGGGGAAHLETEVRNASPGDVFPSGTTIELEGNGGDVNLAIGAIVTPNLAVHATAWGWSTTDPDLKEGGRKQVQRDLTLSMNAFGGGVTWYFGSDFYLSGSVGAAQLTAEVDRVSVDSKTGVAADLTIGKEWWVGRRWGLGVAAGFGAVSIPTDDATLDDHFNGNSFGLRFSATFN